MRELPLLPCQAALQMDGTTRVSGLYKMAVMIAESSLGEIGERN
jgi:hypothetical protein